MVVKVMFWWFYDIAFFRCYFGFSVCGFAAA